MGMKILEIKGDLSWPVSAGRQGNRSPHGPLLGQVSIAPYFVDYKLHGFELRGESAYQPSEEDLAEAVAILIECGAARQVDAIRPSGSS